MRVPRRDRTDDDLRVAIGPLHHTLWDHRLCGWGRADVEARGCDDQHDNRHRCNGGEVLEAPMVSALAGRGGANRGCRT